MEDFADFDFFFKEYYVSLYSYAHSLINNWEVSRDIASDAFEYIWKNFDRIEKATAKSYLFIYVRNRAIDYLRRHRPVGMSPVNAAIDVCQIRPRRRI